MDAPRNRRVPRFPRVSVAHANSSSLVRAHSFVTGGTATEQGWHRCRRRRNRVRIASREASYSLSIIVNLGREILGLLSPVHWYETSLPSLTTSLILNCISARLNCTGTSQCRSINEPANPRSRSSDESGRGSRDSGCLVVVVVSWFVLLGCCVVQRSTGRRLFFVFQSRVTSPRASRSSAWSVRWLLSLCRSPTAGIPLRSFRVSRVAAVGWS